MWDGKEIVMPAEDVAGERVRIRLEDFDVLRA